VLRAGTEDAAHRDVGGLEANRVACNVAALQGSYASVLEPSYVLA